MIGTEVERPQVEMGRAMAHVRMVSGALYVAHVACIRCVMALPAEVSGSFHAVLALTAAASQMGMNRVQANMGELQQAIAKRQQQLQQQQQ